MECKILTFYSSVSLLMLILIVLCIFRYPVASIRLTSMLFAFISHFLVFSSIDYSSEWWRFASMESVIWFHVYVIFRSKLDHIEAPYQSQVISHLREYFPSLLISLTFPASCQPYVFLLLLRFLCLPQMMHYKQRNHLLHESINNPFDQFSDVSVNNN